MPTYNYYCSECDTHFSYFQKMSESHKSICNNCGGKIKRLITGGTGLIFKGSGFYETDYRSESYKKGAAEAKKNKEKKSTDDKKSAPKGKKSKGKSSGDKGGS